MIVSRPHDAMISGRTPVTVIAGYNKLLLSGTVGPLNEEQRRFLKRTGFYLPEERGVPF